MKQLLTGFLGITLLFSACELMDDTSGGLSDSEVVQGLKTALSVGADTASSALSKPGAYYLNEIVKIPLPGEAEAVRNIINNNSTLKTISSSIGLDDKFDLVIQCVNRAAENAAGDAGSIFLDAIDDLTISQGLDILNGVAPDAVGLKSAGYDSTAATQYLKNQTFVPLTLTFAPYINDALGQNLGLGITATGAWTALTTAYNSFMSNTEVQAALALAAMFGNSIDLPAAINDDLGEFCTGKALDGLFYRVGEEEKNIRRNPWEWITTLVGDILIKVFGGE